MIKKIITQGPLQQKLKAKLMYEQKIASNYILKKGKHVIRISL